MASNTGNRLKWPLIVAAILVVLRIVLEQLGAPDSINNLLGVAWLHFLVPFYLAYQIQVVRERPALSSAFQGSLPLFPLHPADGAGDLLDGLPVAVAVPPLPRLRGGNVGEGIGPLKATC